MSYCGKWGLGPKEALAWAKEPPFLIGTLGSRWLQRLDKAQPKQAPREQP